MFATIDIGTNSVRLFIGKFANGKLNPIHTDLITTRLGEGVDQTKTLSSAAMERTYRALTDFHKVLQDRKVENVTVVATSAVRDSVNRLQFAQQVKEQTGWDVLVLSGLEEAQASFCGAVRGLHSKVALKEQVVVLDVGGGSTELISGSKFGAVSQGGSAQLGAVRLTELAVDNLQKMQEIAKDKLQELINTINAVEDFTLIGVGGTITTLASLDLALNDYQAELVTGYKLTPDQVNHWIRRLHGLSLPERAALPGMAAGREDIIIAGLVIVSIAMELLGKDKLVVSDADLLQGIIYLKQEQFS